MKVKQHRFFNNVWEGLPPDVRAKGYQLVLVFGSRELLERPGVLDYLRLEYPAAAIVSCSTAGQIVNTGVCDNSITATAVFFEKSNLRCVVTNIQEHKSSLEAGCELMAQLNQEGLKNVFILSDGTHVNGSELIEGFNLNNKQLVPVTGGLAGDGARFVKTVVGLNNAPAAGNIVAVGFYGCNLLIGHSCRGGWDEFGHERVITKSDRNVLYEIGGRNALELYKDYIGDYTEELPGSALYFPISIKVPGSAKNVVRTILSIDDKLGTMTFAGNMPEGSRVRLMKANFTKLIAAACDAAMSSFDELKAEQPTLAVLVSCVGRKLVLQDRLDEEVFAARKVLGNQTVLTGFYSYGEISPNEKGSKCELHNQTMTITTFSET